MKTFNSFLEEAKKNYNKVYAGKLEAAKRQQMDHFRKHKERFQKQKEEEQNRKEEERENDEYIKHIDNLRAEIKKEVKKEYGIKN